MHPTIQYSMAQAHQQELRHVAEQHARAQRGARPYRFPRLLTAVTRRSRAQQAAPAALSTNTPAYV